jgi:hypothetical protein
MPEDFELPETPDTPKSRGERVVGLFVAGIAVVLAIVTHLGTATLQDEILAHVDSSDQYAFYQAKKERFLALQLQAQRLDLDRGQLPAGAQGAADKLAADYAAEMARLDEEGKGIKDKGDELLVESKHLARKANVLDVGEIALQIAVVLCSISILTDQGMFARLGLAVALFGAAFAAWALLFMR